MGKKITVIHENKSFPKKEANRITSILDKALGKHERFPVDVKMIALELTPGLSSKPPITLVEGDAFSDKFDGMLMKKPKKNEWGIFYNTNIANEGRINFTIAHELGHYFLHMDSNNNDVFKCGEKDILTSFEATIEFEANTFASNLLMPNNDFREQIENQHFSFDLMNHCCNRYETSLTATVSKWLSLTTKKAIAILSEDGGMHWAISNEKAFRFGKFFKTRKSYNEIPKESMAALENFSWEARNGTRQKKGVWFNDEEVMEYSIFSEEYSKTLTVLILDDQYTYDIPNQEQIDRELIIDTYTNFINNGQQKY